MSSTQYKVEHHVSLYKTFPPDKACRIMNKLDIHYTSKHGGWLNMAEIEPGILFRRCLDRRISDQETLKKRNGCVARNPK